MPDTFASQIIDHSGPQSELCQAALDQLLPGATHSEDPQLISPKAARAIAKAYAPYSAAPMELLSALKKYYGLLVLKIGGEIAPDCDLLQGIDPAAYPLRGPACDLPIDKIELLAEIVLNQQNVDVFRLLYERLFPRDVRHARGEYYTPEWLADLTLKRLRHRKMARMLDPSCGSGIFLKKAAQNLADEEPVLELLYGFDTNPLAVLTARVNLLAILKSNGQAVSKCPHVYIHDCVCGTNRWGDFDEIIGNPPWVLWDNLLPEYREQTARLWKDYGLFNLPHTQARLGGGKKDLAMLVTYAAAEKYLKSGGRLAFVINQGIFQSARAGAGFRRFQLGEAGEHLHVESFDDLSALALFDAAARPGIVVLEKGKRTQYPVPYLLWTSKCTEPSKKFARPISEDTGPWKITDARSEASAPSTRTYTARTGAFSGGANAVYWLRILEENEAHVLVENLFACGRSEVRRLKAKLEPELIYPLLRWRDVRRWRAVPGQHIVVPQDVSARQAILQDKLREEFPLTLDYLSQFADVLAGRKSKMVRDLMRRSAFYTMFGVGEYTLSPWKVVWRRMTKEITAAVAGQCAVAGGCKPMVPQETLTFIPCVSEDEAHYLAAVLNSAAATERARSFAVAGNKSFGSAGMLKYLSPQRFQKDNPVHRVLSELSQRAHALCGQKKETSAVEAEVSQLVAEHQLLD